MGGQEKKKGFRGGQRRSWMFLCTTDFHAALFGDRRNAFFEKIN